MKMVSFFANVVMLSALAFRAFIYIAERGGEPQQEGYRILWTWIIQPVFFVSMCAAIAPNGSKMDWFGFGVISLIVLKCLFAAAWSGDRKGDEYRRGQQIVSAKAIRKWTKNKTCRSNLGEIEVPSDSEPLSFLFAGAPGSGKTLAFHQLMQPARATAAAVVADVGGAFASKYFRDGDVILNPLDSRCPPWSPLAEMSGSWDADRLAQSFVPDGEGSSAEWNHYAQTLFSAVLSHVFESGGTNQDLYRLLVVANAEELAPICSGSEASKLFAEGNERMRSSVEAILATYAKPLRDLNPTAGEEGFSISKVIKSDKKRWIFLTARDDQLAYLKPLIAAQIDIAASALLQLSESRERRVWFFLDEFATFGSVNSAPLLFGKGRKYGGCIVVGLQSISQFFEAYSQHTARTLLGCLGTWLVLRSPDPETADFMSRYIGEAEIMRTQNSGSDDKTNWSEHVTKERVVMPSEISNLSDRRGIVNLAGEAPAAWTTIPITHLPEVCEPFVLRTEQRKRVETVGG